MDNQSLTLPEELILMLLNDENGYFHQVPGWKLNCAVVGAALAELSLQSRIDTDLDSLFLVDDAPTGDPALDPALKEIASESEQQNTQFWIERLARRADSIVDLTLDRLVKLKIIEAHNGNFWTISRGIWQQDAFGTSQEGDGTAREFIKTRIGRVIFTDEIPDPRDVIVIALVNTCDVFRFIFQLDEAAEERISFISGMDLIGRSMADAVVANMAVGLYQRSSLTKSIPTIPLRKLLRNPEIREGNMPAMFGALAEEYGPVFQIKPPFTAPKLFLAGVNVNAWMNRNGRLHLRTRDYFADFEGLYGASGVLPSLDGADHFRLRRSLAPAYSRKRLVGRVHDVYAQFRGYVANWSVGYTETARTMCRNLINAQISPLSMSVDSQDIFEDFIGFKERALMTHVVRALPKFMINTPKMRRKKKQVDVFIKRVESVHTPAQRTGCPRDLADDLFSLHASDPQFVPAANLRFAIPAAPIASVYLGDCLSFTMYAMATHPDFCAKIRAEADALFADGDPPGSAINPQSTAFTQLFIMECLRLYPIVPMSMRTVMNQFVIEDYEIPLGATLHIVQTAPHFMENVFPDPHKFDPYRFAAPRNEHRSPGYAPYGLGTHRCLGFRWMELQLQINILLLAHYYTFDVYPERFKLRYSPIPNNKPSRKMKFRVTQQHHELPK